MVLKPTLRLCCLGSLIPPLAGDAEGAPECSPTPPSRWAVAAGDAAALGVAVGGWAMLVAALLK